MTGVKIFKICLGALLAACVGVFVWGSFEPEEFFQSVTNELGVPADCEVRHGSESIWTFSIDADQTLSRFSLFDYPEVVSWTCKTANGELTGSHSKNNGCVIWIPNRNINLWVPQPVTDQEVGASFC
jgi:hypothetical protein